ncbi:putative DNA repair helicase RadD [bioreactor metagenome]|uniref:Putative DNA repair helicase RadD n=1 Tax=bioreactor metagenome TaxID=1076179 RepID=A0A644VJJ6_9ZZZZ|nr:DEAD/DEAH box helicase [Acidaminococcaceae bacterium]
MINLRDYQVSMIDDLEYEYKKGTRCVCMVGPCGCGKTILVAWMAAATALNNRRVLFLVHRQELIDQSSETFTAMNITHGIIATKQPKQYERMVQIGSVQTVVRRLGEIPAPEFIIIDECHHVLANTYRKILDRYPSAHVLGVTATPERMGGHGLGDVFQSMTIGPSVKQLISWGNLAPFDLYAPPSKFDASQLRVKFGDYVREDLQLAMDDNTIIGDLIESYHKYAEGLKAICYCVSLQHSEHVARSFREAGIAAQHIDGETPKQLREQIIKDFRSGRVRILCNVDLISEGFDVPSAGAVILARPTQSLTLFIQQAMRAMRPDENNPDKRAIIIDHVGNVFRHGMPDEDRDWSLESKKKRKMPTRIIKYKSKLAHNVSKYMRLQHRAHIAAMFTL